MSVQTFLDGRVTLHAGDCIDVLAALPENSIDSVVCDPPYHLTSIVKRFGKTSEADDTKTSERSRNRSDGYARLAAGGFMGKVWDGGDIAFQPATWAAVLRVLKPGGYLLAFASTRGFGRMSVAIEDAGFNTHPLIAWIFGSGFPKATRIKAEGYDGFRYGGQALKPAIEPIFMGQKPFSEGNGTANILLHGTGALNIDGCRVSSETCGSALGLDHCGCGWPHAECAEDRKIGSPSWGGPMKRLSAAPGQQGKLVPRTPPSDLGRWPANLIHDGSDEVLAGFPETTSGALTAEQQINGGWKGTVNCYGTGAHGGDNEYDASSGSASRFFYTAKADAEDRLGSKHPTVKPLDLMQYLCRLVTPPGGTILDPFAGTGTTGEAAWREGFRAVLIEREAEYQADIARRMDLVLKPAKRSAVAKSKNKLMGAEGTPLFGGEAA